LLSSVGCGVFAKKSIHQGDFIAEYRGEVISWEEGERRLRKPGGGSFIFFVGKTMW
jgi:SET domain-containing protein